MISEPVNGQVGKRLKSDYYQLDKAATPVDLFISPKNTFLINESGIYKQDRKSFVKKFISSSAITCALEEDSVLWIGTQKGLLRVNKKNFSSKLVPLPLEENQPLITTILKDYSGTIWVGAEAYGVFKLVANKFEKVLGAVPVNAGTATSDSSVWIGTNTGLHRWKDKHWVRYNEEGVTNFEIPDNVVEKLKIDNNNNLWVVLSEGVTVFEAKSHASVSDGHTHLPSVKFVGKPQNAIHSVIYVKKQGYVFATGMGLLFLPNGDSNHLTNIEPSQATDIVENKQILHQIQVPGSGTLDFSNPTVLKYDKRDNLWLVNSQGINVLTVKNFVKLLQEAKAKREDFVRARVFLK